MKNFHRMSIKEKKVLGSIGNEHFSRMEGSISLKVYDVNQYHLLNTESKWKHIYIPGYNQSPSGNLARTSITPYRKSK